MILRKLVLGIADGIVQADGEQVYEVSDLKVGLFQDATRRQRRRWRRADMRRVVVTGLGVVSSIGNNAAEVTRSLKDGKSGIEFVPQYKELGFRSQVAGTLKLDVDELVDRRLRRFMGDGAAFAYLAMQQAIADAGLAETEISNERTGLIAGSGGPDHGRHRAVGDHRQGEGAQADRAVHGAARHVEHRLGEPRHRLQDQGPQLFDQLGLLDLGALHRQRRRVIQLGKQDSMFAGGGEELDWTLSVLFDAMGAMSSKYNDTPERASRAYDKDRDGFVISGGGGIVVLEDLELARARGAKIYAEVIGYGATSDGADMVAPSGEGAVRCMKLAMAAFPARPAATRRSTTSTPTAPRRRSATSSSSTPSAASSATTACRPSARPSR